jgi:hypothetical protein
VDEEAIATFPKKLENPEKARKNLTNYAGRFVSCPRP